MTAAVQETQNTMTLRLVSVPGLSGKVLSGLYAIILAFSANYSAIQGFNIHQMDLAASLQERQADEARIAIAEMDGVTAEIRKILEENSGSKDKDAKASTLVAEQTAKLNIMNTAYNQKNAYYSGMVQGVNQNSADTTQTLSTDLTMMGTNGVLATLQTVTQCLA
jgi:hypothetical protein